MSALLKRIENGEIAVPSLPTVASRIIELIDDEDVSIKNVGEIIGRSQSVAVQLLKIANSPFYRGENEITTIEAAIKRVGLDLVKSAVLNISLLEVLKDGTNSSQAQEKLWQESFTMAVAARLLARRTNYRNPEEAFTAGLVTHIGIMILLDVLGRDYLELLRERSCRRTDLGVLERAAFQTDHGDVGYTVLTLWKFPETMKEVVKHHGFQEKQFSADKQLVKLIKIVHVAEKIAGFFIFENPALNIDIIRLCKQSFDIDEKEVNALLRQAQHEVNEAASLLSFDRILNKSYDQIYRNAVGKLADLNQKYDELNKTLIKLSWR